MESLYFCVSLIFYWLINMNLVQSHELQFGEIV
jgi:hypothetical protein